MFNCVSRYSFVFCQPSFHIYSFLAHAIHFTIHQSIFWLPSAPISSLFCHMTLIPPHDTSVLAFPSLCAAIILPLMYSLFGIFLSLVKCQSISTFASPTHILFIHHRPVQSIILTLVHRNYSSHIFGFCSCLNVLSNKLK